MISVRMIKKKCKKCGQTKVFNSRFHSCMDCKRKKASESQMAHKSLRKPPTNGLR